MQSKNKTYYEEEYYNDQDSWTRPAARAVMEVLFEHYKPESVVDLGCGSAICLDMLKNEFNVSQILGVDGDWIKEEQLLISKENFHRHNFEKPLKLDKRFDLAVSMEVAEHLHEPFAKGFIESLTGLSDVVVFSAAVPGQDGFNHYNEQWQSYWADIFAKFDYGAIDLFRDKLWQQENIRTDYKQNSMLYVHNKLLKDENSIWNKLSCNQEDIVFNRIHPDLFLRRLSLEGDLEIIGLKKVVTKLPKLIINALTKRLGN